MTAAVRPSGGGVRRLPWEVLATLGLFAGLLAVVAVVGGGARPDRPYDLASGGPRGLLALRLWLDELGYRVETNDGEQFGVPDGARLLLVFPGVQPFTSDEAEAVAGWVEAGGTLVVVAPPAREAAVIATFGVGPAAGVTTNPTAPLRQRQPWLPAAPEEVGQLGFDPPLDLTGAPLAVPVVATDAGQVTLAVQPRGAGRVWHLARQHDLTNDGLRLRADGHIALALLRGVPPGGRVVVDTFHLNGPPAARAPALQDWLYGTPVGWALLFGGGAVLLSLLLQGWRLGPPLPARHEPRRRAAAEYVSAMAGLRRRARLGRSVAAYHKRRLKRELGRRLQVSADLDDAAYLERLRLSGDHLDGETLAAVERLLMALDGRPSEADLVRLVAAIDAIDAMVERR